MSVCIGVCMRLSTVACKNRFKITLCLGWALVCKRPLGHYCTLRGHAHSHAHTHLKFVIARKAQDKPKNSVPRLLENISHTPTHTRGLPKGLYCKSLILAKAMTLSLHLSFDCTFLNFDCHCCYTILQAIHPNGTTDTHMQTDTGC